MGKLTEKLKAVAAAVAAIEKQFGKGAVMQLGGEAAEQKVAVIPSGSIGVGRAFGVGGYPRGRGGGGFGHGSCGQAAAGPARVAQGAGQAGRAGLRGGRRS